MISENKVVKLNYKLYEGSAQGELIESTYGSSPLSFIYGLGSMIPQFEESLYGKEKGASFSFGIEAEQAYGPVDENALVDLDINIFEVHGKVDYDVLKIGNKVPMQDSHGNRLDGVVKELTETTVVMDFNHPLAGKDLYFEGEIIDVYEASAEEIAHGHVHDGHHHHEHEHDHGHGHGHGHDDGGCGCGSGCGCH